MFLKSQSCLKVKEKASLEVLLVFQQIKKYHLPGLSQTPLQLTLYFLKNYGKSYNDPTRQIILLLVSQIIKLRLHYVK